ncbi:MFS general substrate transporter [Cadophora sp. DSE1049]|nr:MFS general substrate transporter [Cadophora sp. DSE1049]
MLSKQKQPETNAASAPSESPKDDTNAPFSLKTKEKDEISDASPASRTTPGRPGDDDIVYPTGLKLVLLLTCMFVGMFLVSLDKLIISTTIPQITNNFNSAGDIGWYGTAYLLTSCAFQLVFGKIYAYFSIKWTFMSSILLFEIGSALCGAAPNSITFILGRAIAGLGGGGVMSGVMVVIVYALPLHKRPKVQGFFGAVFGISSIAGPLIGGAFTTKATWRWCFYLNLPLGAIVLILVPFLLDIPDRPNTKVPLNDKLRQLNALGMLALLPGVVCLCLALQWGGTTYAWSEARIIVLLAIAFALLIAFVLIQIWKPDQATVPPRIFIQRSIFSAFWLSSCIGIQTQIFAFYLPLWFQAVKGDSALKSGTDLLPLLLLSFVSSIITGILVSRIGYYTPFAIFGSCLSAVGAGLLTTLEVNSSTAKWVGYQVFYGYALGSMTQAPNMAAQTVLSRQDVPIGASLMFFGQQLFGAVFVSVGQNVLDNQLVKRLANIPGMQTISPQQIQSTGATALLHLVPAAFRSEGLKAYNDSLRVCFQVGLIIACISVFGAAGLEWKSVRKNLPPKRPDVEKVAQGSSDKEIEVKGRDS